MAICESDAMGDGSAETRRRVNDGSFRANTRCKSVVGRVAGCVLVSALLAFTNVYGSSIQANQDPDLSLSAMLPDFLIQWAVFVAITLIVSKLLRCAAQCSAFRNTKLERLFDRLTPQLTAKSIALFTAVMLVCWIPCMLAFFPANMNWDTFYQISQCYPGEYPIYFIPWADAGAYTDARFSDHHPIFTTLVYGLFARVSDVLFGSWNAGLFVLAFLQCVVTAASLVFACAYFRRRGGARWLILLAYVLFCTSSLVSNAAMTILKDSFFAWIYVLFFIAMFEVVRSRGEVLSRRRNLLLFIALLMLLSLTKKTGIYLSVVSVVVCALYYRRYWKQWLAAFLAPAVLMFVLMPYVVFPALDVIPGGKQELLGPLFQQTARYALEHPDEVTDEQREAIDAVLPYDDLASLYDYSFSDPVKFQWRYDTASTADLVTYFGVWAQQGLQDPRTYIEATAGNCYAFFSDTATFPITPFFGTDVDVQLLKSWQPEAFGGLSQAYSEFYVQLADIPIVGFVLHSVLYTWWIPILCLFALGKRIGVLLPALIPTLFLIFCNLIAPTGDLRYAWPLVFTAPLLICAVVVALRGGWQHGGQSDVSASAHREDAAAAIRE